MNARLSFLVKHPIVLLVTLRSLRLISLRDRLKHSVRSLATVDCTYSSSLMTSFRHHWFIFMGSSWDHKGPLFGWLVLNVMVHAASKAQLFLRLRRNESLNVFPNLSSLVMKRIPYWRTGKRVLYRTRNTLVIVSIISRGSSVYRRKLNRWYCQYVLLIKLVLVNKILLRTLPHLILKTVSNLLYTTSP